jgi:hypothetical protein
MTSDMHQATDSFLTEWCNRRTLERFSLLPQKIELFDGQRHLLCASEA